MLSLHSIVCVDFAIMFSYVYFRHVRLPIIIFSQLQAAAINFVSRNSRNSLRRSGECISHKEQHRSDISVFLITLLFCCCLTDKKTMWYDVISTSLNNAFVRNWGRRTSPRGVVSATVAATLSRYTPCLWKPENTLYEKYRYRRNFYRKYRYWLQKALPAHP